MNDSKSIRKSIVSCKAEELSQERLNNKTNRDAIYQVNGILDKSKVLPLADIIQSADAIPNPSLVNR